MNGYMNPYSGETFFEVIGTFFQRLFFLLTGQLSFQSLASDDIQILVLMAVAASGSLVGSFLILRRMTMLANALSHTILLGIVGVYLFTKTGLFEEAGGVDIQAMLSAAFVMGLVTTFLTQFLTVTVKLQEDASTGLVFTTLFAIGVIIVTLFVRNAHIGIEIVMGNVDALHYKDLILVGIILLLNVILIGVFFKEYLITTFDPGLARALGFSTVFFDYLLMTQVSVTAVGAFKAVGVLMVLALITGPPLIASLLTNQLKKLLIIATVIGCVASLIGVAISRHLLTVYNLPVSTGGLVVCVIIVLYIVAILFAPDKGIVLRACHRKRLKRTAI